MQRTIKKIAALMHNQYFWIYGIGPFLVFYGVLLYLLGALRIEKILIIAVILAFIFIRKTREDALPFLFPLAMVGLFYDFMRFLTPFFHSFQSVHVVEPFVLEKELFGIRYQGGEILIPSQFFLRHNHIAIDLLAAFGYGFFLFEAVGFGFYLAVKQRKVLQRFSWALFCLFFVGMITYYVYPAAPPWYVEQYGLGPALLDVPGHPGRLASVDQYLGIRYFTALYSANTNVFAAIPSLHAAFPLLVWLYSRHIGVGRFQYVFMTFWLLVAFSAVYLNHHYVIDVILGCVYAFLMYLLTEKIYQKLVETND